MRSRKHKVSWSSEQLKFYILTLISLQKFRLPRIAKTLFTEKSGIVVAVVFKGHVTVKNDYACYNYLF